MGRFVLGLPGLPGLLAVALLSAAGCVFGGCRVASPDVPEWIEAHGRGQIIALAADAEGAFAVGSNKRIYIYPGPFMQPWQERFSQDAVAIGAGGGLVGWIAPDGAVRMGSAMLAPREVPGSRDWHASAITMGPDNNMYVVSGGRAWRVVNDALTDPICDGGTATGVAVGLPQTGLTVYVWRLDGTVVARGPGGQCTPVSVPFPVTSLAASPAGDDLAAVDRNGTAWRRRGGNWQALPRARVFRPDRFPYETVIRGVAMSATVLWGRSDDGLAFILSDPT